MRSLERRCSSARYFGRRLITSTKPMTASAPTCAISSTPAARIASPPTPTSRYGTRARHELARHARARAGRRRLLRRRTESHARLVAIGRADSAGKRPLDVVHDRQRHGERLAAVLARHGDRRLAGDRLHERLELQTQRLALRRLDGDALDERLERLRALRLAHERARDRRPCAGDRTRPSPRRGRATDIRSAGRCGASASARATRGSP